MTYFKFGTYDLESFDDVVYRFVTGDAVKRKSHHYELTEDEKSATYTFELPGVKKSDVEVASEDDRINIKWQVRGKDHSTWLPLLRASGDIKASLEDGLLSIVVEKKNKSKKIEVK